MGRLARESGKSRGSLIAATTIELQDHPGANTAEDEDSLPDVAFAVDGRELCGQRSRDDENEDDFHRSHAEFWRTIR